MGFQEDTLVCGEASEAKMAMRSSHLEVQPKKEVLAINQLESSGEEVYIRIQANRNASGGLGIVP